MASTLEFVEYVCDQISDAGVITYRKMFGEYGIYCDGKIIGLICDNMFYVKKTKSGALIIPNLEESAPYDGAKPHFLVDNLEDKSLMTKFILATFQELPLKKPKKEK